MEVREAGSAPSRPGCRQVGGPVERQVAAVVQDHRRAVVDREPAEAAFELVAVEDRAQVPVRHVKLATVAVAVVVGAVVVSNLLVAPGDVAQSGPAVSPSPAPSPTATPRPSPEDPKIDPGKYDIALPEMRIRLTMPAGWSSAEAGTAVVMGSDGDTNTNSPSLAVHDVTRVVPDVCRWYRDVPHQHFEDVGPTVEDLMSALANQVGTQKSGPIDVMLGGYPAKKFVLTLANDSCGGPEGRSLWEDATGSHFGILFHGTATIYVVDVDGDRLVITSHYRGASAEDIAQLEAIIASIDIDSAGIFPTGNRDPQGDLPIGRHSLTVEGVPLSFNVPTQGWERFGSISLNKSFEGPQGAEAIIYWTGFPDGIYADPCSNLLIPPVGPSAADLATAVAAVPLIELVTGPSDVTMGGRAAKHVVLTVRGVVGCDPGFFYTWKDAQVGALWTATSVGDTIRVWIVEVDGTRLFIAGESHKDAGAKLEQEIQQIVDSIRFD